MTKTTQVKPIQNARIAGILYLLMMPLGIFGILYVPSRLIDLGDLALTASNIIANQSLFRLSIVSAFSVQLLQIFVVLALYRVLEPVNKNLALLMLIFILLAVPLAMLNELNHFAILHLLNGAVHATPSTFDQILVSMSLFLGLHETGIFIAQIFWGLWLLPMGYLVYKSNYIPKFIGVLLMIGCFGYLFDSFIFFLLPDFGLTVSDFTFVGELLLPLWLIIKGVDVVEYEKHIHESAQ